MFYIMVLTKLNKRGEAMIKSIGLEGMKGYEINVEADVRTDREACVIIGLPDTTMRESRERILANLYALNYDLSLKRITIQLSPPDKRKTGIGYDCAMLIAVLKKLMPESIQVDEHTCILGGLTLQGEIVPFHGLVPALQQALQMNFKRIILPPIDTSFIQINNTIELVTLESVKQLIAFFTGTLNQQTLQFNKIEQIREVHQSHSDDLSAVDFSMIFGHEKAKRALEIAAAGGHHVLMSGPPGCGKSMLAEAFQTIQPQLSNGEMLETYSIYHLAKEPREFSKTAPYRAPHHSSSAISIIGGGTFPKPGEISLAHNGVLFLDELGEFSKKTLDMLRQPLEQGEITISRVRQSVTYPAKFILIAATNPCPCGYFGSNERYCNCTPKQIKQYQQKVSGPLLDRLDFFLPLQSVALQKHQQAESSSTIRQRVKRARHIQYSRYSALNGSVATARLRRHAVLDNEMFQYLQQQCFQFKWSNRTQTKILRVARTIADLEHAPSILKHHLVEAVEWKHLAPTPLEESYA